MTIPIPRLRRLHTKVTVAVVLLSAGAVTVGVVVQRPPTGEVPAPVLASEQQRVTAVAEAVRLSLNEAVADLQVMATVAATATDEARHTLVTEMLARRDRYTNLVLVDHRRVTAAAEPGIGDLGALPPYPVITVETDGVDVPRIRLSVPLGADSDRHLLAIYSIDHLAFALGGAGRTWLIDGAGRLVAANQGFLAGDSIDESLPSPRARGLVHRLREAPDAEVAASPATRSLDLPGEATVVSARRVTGVGPAAAIDLAVVAERSYASLRLGDHEARRQVLLFAALAVLTATVCIGWLWTSVVQPVVFLAAASARLAAGDVRETVTPRRFDEVGVLARHLERIRLQMQSGGA